MAKMAPVSLQVVLTDGEDALSFLFSRTWTPARTVLNLNAGPLYLVIVSYLVVDADLSVEDLLVVLPVLLNMGVGTKSFSEKRRHLLGGVYCSSIRAASDRARGRQVSRLMIFRLNRLSNVGL